MRWFYRADLAHVSLVCSIFIIMSENVRAVSRNTGPSCLKFHHIFSPDDTVAMSQS